MQYFLMSLVFVLTIHGKAFAQFGVSLSTQLNNFKDWNEALDAAAPSGPSDIFAHSYQISLDYWFRHPNYRIEFFPNAGIELANTTSLQSTIGNVPYDYDFRSLSIGFETHIYVLDFVNDCKCPTFSKQNDLFSKGFFLMLGVKAHTLKKNIVADTRELVDDSFSYKIESGVGLDIGINDLITISPIAAIGYMPSNSWDGLFSFHNIDNSDLLNQSSKNIYFKFGIRLGFRTNYQN